MQAKLIEETLKKIIEIDSKAVLVEKEAVQNEKTKYDELKKLKKEREHAIMKEARKEAKHRYDEIVSAAKLEAEAIEKAGDAECSRLNKLLEDNKEEMVEKVFIRLFEVVMNQSKNKE